MRLQSIHLKRFKRFTDLKVTNLPTAARLVVLVGPNGSGKSSLFEAFNVYSYRARQNNIVDQFYWTKINDDSAPPPQQPNIWTIYGNQVQITFHDHTPFTSGEGSDLDKRAFYIRSSYRYEGDFSVNSISRAGDMTDDPKRPANLISQDTRVADNYQRLVATTLAEIYDSSLDDNTPRKEIRERLIGKVAESLRNVLPNLRLMGPGDPLQDGTFMFEKGTARDWKYKNLSGGEKAAFDLLLDFIVKVERFDDTVFCIDEPESHMHIAVQATLLGELLNHLPGKSQLWIATHSIGMMRAARDLHSARPDEVAFLDFGGHDFDEPVIIEPATPDRAFWKRNFEVALGDLAHLVAPRHIVFCEGAARGAGDGFDAQCYETIFGVEYPDVEFVSTGSASEMQKNALSVSAVMERILSGITFSSLRDRDDASDIEIAEWNAEGLRVLNRRTIESYLWDDEILTRLCYQIEQPDKVHEVLALKRDEMARSQQRGNPVDDVKSAAGNIFTGLRRIFNHPRLGSSRESFSRNVLAPLVAPGTATYDELKQSVFGEKSSPTS